MIIKGNFKAAIQDFQVNKKNNAIKKIYKKPNLHKGPLEGATYTLKDIFAMNDELVEASSNLLANFKPYYNSDVFTLLRNAGASLVGQTNLDEFGMGGTGTYSNKGIIRNPLNNEYMVAGSSSGAAASFNENISFAIGSDTGDSVRLPSNHIGVVGFKPTYGSVSRYGLFPFASSLDTVAWFTHNVQDSYTISKILFGKSEKDMTSIDVQLDPLKKTKPSKVIAFDVLKYLKEPVKKAYLNLIKKLKEKKVNVDFIKINEELISSIKPVYKVLSYSEASSNLANLTGLIFGSHEKGNNWEEIMTNTRSKYFGLLVKRRLTLGAYFLHKNNQEEIFLRAKKVRRLISDYSIKQFENADLIIFPTSSSWAPKFKEDMSAYKFMNFILSKANLVGNPSISLFLGRDKKCKMPFSITLETNKNEDSKLLNKALYIEELIKVINND